MTWLYNGHEITEEDVGNNAGFVYLITNTVTGKKYIGKKYFRKKKIKRSVRRKNRKHYTVDSDWKDYYGSNKELLADIEKHGVDGVVREILHICSTRGWCSYLEAQEQFQRNVLLDDKYYNTWIMVRCRKEHLKNKKS